MTLNAASIRFLESRNISIEIAEKMGLYSDGNKLCIPYHDDLGGVVNIKYRSVKEKEFSSMPGGTRDLYNFAYVKTLPDSGPHPPLIICEGELDALAFMTAGYPNVVSMPNGAPTEKESLTTADKASEERGRFAGLYALRDRLKEINSFILAVDNDEPGRRLVKGLRSRLGDRRCNSVSYPAGCKDANDVLLKAGQDGIKDLVENAKPIPIEGLMKLSDYSEPPEMRFFSTGMPGLDEYVKLWAGSFVVVTGTPGAGKSTVMTNVLAKLNREYGMAAAIVSPEMRVKPFLRSKFRRAYAGAHYQLYGDADRWIEENFVFIDLPDDEGGDETSFTLDWILDRAEDAIWRFNIGILMIDPWNDVAHTLKPGETETMYITRMIRQIKHFARKTGVMVIIVAHPTKAVSAGQHTGRARKPTLYDIEGSAAWFNKADVGLVVHLVDDEVQCWIDKVRFMESGRRGMVRWLFDRETESYSLAPTEDEE